MLPSRAPFAKQLHRLDVPERNAAIHRWIVRFVCGRIFCAPDSCLLRKSHAARRFPYSTSGWRECRLVASSSGVGVLKPPPSAISSGGRAASCSPSFCHGSGFYAVGHGPHIPSFAPALLTTSVLSHSLPTSHHSPSAWRHNIQSVHAEGDAFETRLASSGG